MTQQRINLIARPHWRAAWLLLVGAFGLPLAAQAAITDVAQVPLVTSSQSVVKPNLMFILDDSGSMGWDYMPDEANFSVGKYGFYAPQCNGLAYDPDPKVLYPVPVTSTGADYPAGTYTFRTPASLNNQRTVTSAAPTIATGTLTVTLNTANNANQVGDVVTIYSNDNTANLMVGTVTAWNNNTLSLTVTVTSTAGSGTLTNPRIGDGDSSTYYYTYSGSEPKLSYVYTSNGLDTTTLFYRECNSTVGSTPGSGVFTRVNVTASSADLQKYRNWYTYYRTRSLMMRSAASLAFKPIGDRYRVGFSTISTASVNGTNFLDVAEFTAAQKSSFYSALFGADPGGRTPLRGALSKAGKYFAKQGKLTNGSAQTYDPIQYACQRNFAILTTDGYWNTQDETSTYGPLGLYGTNVGQQDGVGTPRPLNDGASGAMQARTSNLQKRSITTQDQTSTSTLQTRTQTPAQPQTSTSTLQARSVTGSWQTSTSVLQVNTGQLQQQDRVSGTWSTTWTNVTRCTWNSNTRCQYVWTGFTNATGSCTVAAAGTSTANNTRWNGPARQCQYTGWSAFANTASCTAVPQSTASPYGTLTAVQCNPPVYGAWTAVANCTTSATNECQYTAWTAYINSASCTALAQSPGSPYTVGTATRCNTIPASNGPWTTATGPCTASTTTGCQYTGWTGYINTASCTPLAQSGASPFSVLTASRCNAVVTNGAWTDASTCTISATNGCQYAAWTPWSNVASCTPLAQSTASPYSVGVATQCQSTVIGQGSTDSLADVAMYYYEHDLRTPGLNNCASTVNGNPIDVCENIVKPSGADNATWQHMVTYTLGMGVSGTLRYQPNYINEPSGDYHDVVQGTKDWPIPTQDSATAVDDLWHAAVDGRGQYFSAGSPSALAKSLSDALRGINVQMGAGSGAAASTLQPVEGDNTLFIAKYQSELWNGDLIARDIDPVSGVISDPRWSAAQKLQAKVDAGTARAIYYGKRSAGANATTRREFSYANLSTDGLNGKFDNACSKTVALTQCTTLTAADVTTANSGSNMVDYLRGGANDVVYRARTKGDPLAIAGGILGDIIGGAPVYVRKAAFNYTENNYAGFAATMAGRLGVVYAGSNDGMLHAFDGATGEELWAYVPSMVMDRMYRLADNDYANRHEYFVNAAPSIGDIYVPPVAPATVGSWKTILVGGLGAGGRGYYALDITDPNNPQTLWEFSNDSLGGANNLGQTFGNPVITKRADGTWVVAFTSGYNNAVFTGDLTPGDGAAPGDGNGHLFVVNANTGQRVLDIATYTTGTTGAGSAATPSGLGKLNAWVDTDSDNTAKRFYAGDLLGNLWRFDVDNLVAPNRAALRLAYFSIGGVPQPITTQPALAKVNYSGTVVPVVYVGTGKYLGTTDLGNTAVQSVYAIKDPLTNTPLGDAHASSTVVAQTLSLKDPAVKTSDRATTNLPVDWSTGNGWRIDLTVASLPTPGERVNVDMQLLNNTLTVASNIPSTDVCVSGGLSYFYQFDIGTGNATTATLFGDSMVVGISWVTLQVQGGAAGSGRTVTITVDNKTTPRIDDVPPPPPPLSVGRRTSWRELVE